LSQEPQLDPKKNVLAHVEEAVAGTRALLTRFEDLSMKLGEDLPEAEMDKVMAEQARVQDQIEAANAWELDGTLGIAMAALRLDPAAGAGGWAPLGGQLLILAAAEGEPPGPGGEGSLLPAAHPATRAGVGAPVPPRPPGQGQSPPGPL